MNRFFVKLIIFICIIFVFESVVYYLVPHERPEPKEVSLLKNHIKKNVDVIYFGDSSAESYHDQDQNKSTLPEFLEKDLTEYQLGAITHPAYKMDIYEKYLKFIINHNQAVKIVVIPINLRSFSKEWEENSGYNFKKEKIFLDYNSPILNILYQPMAAFKAFENSVTTTRQSMITSDLTDSNDNMARQLTQRYMYKLSADQQGVKSLRKIAEDLKGSNIKALFYITPVDYQTASEYFRDEFEKNVSQNISLIKETLAQPNIYVLDLSFTLDQESFDWQKIYLNEHLKENGRRFVAQQLAEYIDNYLGGH